ncbi:MAG: AsmA family protein [Acidovorax sp.]|uniref:AsmA family protein n=1 Tax=Acidovorax sp. TaxID=1872122 RepID=UPI003919CCCF
MGADTSHPTNARKALTVALLAVVGMFVGLLVVATIALLQLDRMRPWLNDKVSEVTGRRFEVQGQLSGSWQWPLPLEEGWRRWIPGVVVKGERLVMDNPAGFQPPFASDKNKAAKAVAKNVPATTDVAGADDRTPTTATQADSPTMVSIDRATASVQLWPLLARHLSMDTVSLQHPEIALARTADGANNWTFQPKDDEAPRSGWTFDVDRLVISDGLLAYADGVKDLDLQARVQTTEPVDAMGQTAVAKTPAASAASAPNAAPDAAAAASTASAPSSSAAAKDSGRATPATYGLRFQLEGRYAKAQVQGSGQAGHVISLRDKVVDYPLQIELTAGSVALAAEGILANPGALSGLDFDVALRGGSMSDLYAVTGLVLPSTPAFKTRGRLTGSLEPERAVWDYTDFRGNVGESDLQGSLKYTSGKPRPRLTGTMTSNQLRLADLGPALGTDSPDNTHRGRDRATGQRGKVLPDSNFAADRWNAMDMDIVFKGRHIIRPESLPLENLSTRAVMENAQLKLDPLTFGVAEGKIESQVTIDGRKAPLKAQIRGTVQGLQLSALFPKVELMKKSFGRMDGAIALESTGNSVAGLLGKGTGEMRLYVRDGTLSKQMLDLAALNVGSIIVGKLFGDTQEVHLRCAVADFTVVDGLATTRIVKMSTDDAVIEATGTINLGTEEMNLRIKPESLEWKFLSLRSPLYVKGTFGNPDIGVETGPLLLRAGAAVVAAVVAPVALALVPITVPAADDDTHCKPLLDLAKQPVKPGAQGAAGTASQPARQATSRPVVK